MKSKQNLYVQTFWKSALLWIMTNKKATSTWLPDEELLRKMKTFNVDADQCNVYELNRALNNNSLMGWINDRCSHTSNVIHVAKNKKNIKIRSGEYRKVSFYLISLKPPFFF